MDVGSEILELTFVCYVGKSRSTDETKVDKFKLNAFFTQHNVACELLKFVYNFFYLFFLILKDILNKS